MRSKLFIGLAAGIVVLLLSGCATSPTAQEVYSLEPLPAGVSVADASITHLYEDLDEVISTAELIVLARPAASRETVVGDLPFTIVTFEVQATLTGEAVKTIDVRYTGGEKLRVPDLPSLPRSELQYLLVLETFTFDGKTSTGEYVVVGPGQWVRATNDQRFAIDIVSRADVLAGSAVPADLSQSELERQVLASTTQ